MSGKPRKSAALEPSEHAIQTAMVEWSVRAAGAIPELRLLYAVPNGGARNLIVARKLKAEGVKPGVPDLHLPVARLGFHGLWIETKTKVGRVSPDQRVWHAALREQGHLVVVVRSALQGIELLSGYLAGLLQPAQMS